MIAAYGAGPEEAHERPGLGRGQVAGGAQGGQHPARGRMAQVHQVRQARAAVLGDGRGDGDHLHEGGRALLHARPAGAGQGQQRQTLSGGPPDRRDHPGRGGHAHGAAQEPELPGQDRCRHAVQLDASDEHRLVGPGIGCSPVELGTVGGVVGLPAAG